MGQLATLSNIHVLLSSKIKRSADREHPSDVFQRIY